VLDRMNGMPRCHRLWELSVALVKKWAVPMSVCVEGMVCRLVVVCVGGWCVALLCESSSRDWKK
jgi:hypothetical protein